ncbi:DUF3833 domain-containing protein [Thalassotalea hakodatensis]|uniref:DUF3833 domain-containing protein n=1 Tax=Thalassotalea hakodatensis TaxID=3030492 RepID=UPI002573487B|nr:DUF3833 domain-containing protein [Thalassotalea hakodatensis]
MNNVLTSLVIATCLIGCSSDVSDYRNTSPKLDIKSYFSGKLVGWGMINKYDNKVSRRFCVEIIGTWLGNKGELDETFYFLDGEVSKRVWQLNLEANGKYNGQAHDVIGTAKGQQVGMAFNWQYELDVEIDNDVIRFSMDDWMYQLDDNRVMNKTAMNKYGITVADITLFFDKSVQQCSNR